jgi:hypothetical protein
MNKMIVLVAVAAVVCCGGLVLAFGNTSGSADLEYSYKIQEINAYTDSLDSVRTPGEGNILAAVEITMKCNGSLFVIAGTDFSMVDNGTTYEAKSYDPVVSLSKGDTKKYTAIYEIPASFTKLTIKCKEEGNIACTTADGFTTLNKVEVVPVSVNWDYRLVGTPTSFTGDDSIVRNASSGMKFVIFEVIEKNKSYSGADFKPSLSHFKLKASDNSTYSYSYNSYGYNDCNNLSDLTLGIGASKTYHIVFEIPSSAIVSAVYFEGGYIKYMPGQDDSLLP